MLVLNIFNDMWYVLKEFLWKLAIFIYNIVGMLFELCVDLASVDLFKSSIEEVTKKVYLLLGIIMVFKVAISCLQYLINPSGDKNKGFTDILTRTIKSVLLIVFVPTIFTFAKDAQNVIVAQIPKFIFGSSYSQTDQSYSPKAIGDSMSYDTLMSLMDHASCHQGWFKGMPYGSNESEIVGETKKKQDNSKSSKAISNNYELDTELNKVVRLTCKDANGNTVESYHMTLLSYLAGGFIVFIMIGLTIDVGIRTIKFGILELVAPICIASYVDPKSADKSFKKWYSESIKVYTNLFINLLTIYLCIYFIKECIMNFQIDKSSISTSVSLIKITLLISLLYFMKEAPKFLTNILGIGDAGLGGLTGMFKKSGGLLGAATALRRDSHVAGANAAARDPKHKLAARLRGASMGAASSLIASAGSMYNGKGWKDTRSASQARVKSKFNEYEGMKSAGVSAREYLKQKRRVAAGYDSPSNGLKLEIDAAKTSSDSSKAALDYVHNNISEKFARVRVNSSVPGGAAIQSKINAMGSVNFSRADGTTETVDFTQIGNGNVTLSEGIAQLQTIKDNKNSMYSAEAVSMASAQLDILQGHADKYIVSLASSYTDKSVIANDPNRTEAERNAAKTQMASIIADVTGQAHPTNTAEVESLINDYGGNISNPAFIRAIEDAKVACAEHQGDSEWGGKVVDNAVKNGWGEMKNGRLVIKPEYMGDYLAYCKKEGQTHQTNKKREQQQAKNYAEKKARELAEKNKK